jgi:two-component system, OmpR family, KDP operon response regulator KdpE
VAEILIVDDEPMLRQALGTSLRTRGFETRDADSGEAGLASVAARTPDLVILDLGLPDDDGIRVLQRLRAGSTVPVIVLTARDAQDEKVRALDAGADDYVTKPFDPAELAARIRAILRRGADAPSHEVVIRSGNVTIDLARKVLDVGGEHARLTRTEWQLLELFATNPGRLLTHVHLLQSIWGPEYGHETNYLRTFVGQLRKKLTDNAANPRFIVTEPGIGYRWIAGDVPPSAT